jgi:hypothetical protein
MAYRVPRASTPRSGRCEVALQAVATHARPFDFERFRSSADASWNADPDCSLPIW